MTMTISALNADCRIDSTAPCASRLLQRKRQSLQAARPSEDW
jgi:hypothetical protein